MKLYYLSGLAGALLAILGCLILLAIGDGVATPVNPDQYLVLKDYISPIVSGFAGALAGACCAYLLSTHQQARRDDEQAVELYISSLYTVTAMLEGVAGIAKDVVRPHENSDVRFLVVPYLGYSLGNYDLETDKRLFGVFVRFDAADAIIKLVLAASKYKSLMHQIQERRNLMGEYVDIINLHGGAHSIRSLGELSDIVGQSRLLNLYVAAESFLTTLQQAEVALMDLLVCLKDRGRAYFDSKGVKAFHPQLRSEAPESIAPPKIASLEELIALLNNPLRSGVPLAEGDWTYPGALKVPDFL